MESDNGFPVEDEKRVVFENANGEGLFLGLNKESLTDDEPFLDEIIEDKKSLINPSVPEVELPKDVTKIKKSNVGTNNPTTKCKNQLDLKGSTVVGRTTKPTLSQSLSFPVRGRHSDVMKTKPEVYKSEAIQGRKAAEKVDSKVSNGNGLCKVMKNSGKGGAPRRSTIASRPSFRQPPSGRRASADGTEAGPTHDLLTENNLELKNNELPAKEEEEEDARSITSSTLTPRAAQQRINVSTFSFRLEQRAAKRKEFFSKVEEKIHAKEQEKSNLQAKSKESQEAEIKQLRKSLTFKATPMPSFYKEPPPKIELKKIPTTRAKSPKFGRNKGNASMPSNSLENGGSCVSPKNPKINADKEKKRLPKRSSLSKPENQESLTATKANQTEKEGQNEQTKSSEEIRDRPFCTPEIEDIKDEGHGSNLAQCNGSNLNHEALTAAAEVPVEG